LPRPPSSGGPRSSSKTTSKPAVLCCDWSVCRRLSCDWSACGCLSRNRSAYGLLRCDWSVSGLEFEVELAPVGGQAPGSGPGQGQRSGGYVSLSVVGVMEENRRSDQAAMALNTNQGLSAQVMPNVP
jgi:hypothetical protein